MRAYTFPAYPPDEVLAALAVGYFLVRAQMQPEVRQLADEISRATEHRLLFGEGQA